MLRHSSRVPPIPIVAVTTFLLAACASERPVEPRWSDSEVRGHLAAMASHHLCSGTFVVGRGHVRDPFRVLAEDIRPFPDFSWQDDFLYEVEMVARTATVWGPGIEPRTAEYNGDQGCSIRPVGAEDVFFSPVTVRRNLPDPATQPWPTGDAGAYEDFPEVRGESLDAALDWAMEQPQNTRAFLVVYRGKIIGERYAGGFTRDTPQISWSKGKSITAALIGILVQQGKLSLDQLAPIPEWRSPGDPRGTIRIRHLLHMSSGLDFRNQGLGRPGAWLRENEHFRVYFDAIDVFDHATRQPVALPPDSAFRYLNSDPLALGSIIRRIVEDGGEEYLSFPQRALFDRIGARDFVLEPDAWGNFIMTGYDYGSAGDWARFGLLHLRDGVWDGQRILPEGWSEFVSTPAPAASREEYGALFWLNRNGGLDRIPTDAYWAAGYMGQITMIIPSRDLVIVRLGPSPGGSNLYMNEAVGRILESIDG